MDGTKNEGTSAHDVQNFGEHTRDAPLDAITREDIDEFLNKLAKLDRNYGRYSAGKTLSLTELLAKHSAAQGDGIGNRTLNRHVGFVEGMFAWAIKAGKLVGANPAEGHHQSEAINETDGDRTRRKLSLDELTKLFNGPLFAISFTDGPIQRGTLLTRTLRLANAQIFCIPACGLTRCAAFAQRML